MSSAWKIPGITAKARVELRRYGHYLTTGVVFPEAQSFFARIFARFAL